MKKSLLSPHKEEPVRAKQLQSSAEDFLRGQPRLPSLLAGRMDIQCVYR
jgi:hypothetical protein